MDKEELITLNMKNVILDKWKSKLGYPLNHKDIEELENIIDYYEGENQKYKEVIDKLKDKTKENIENAKYEITTITVGDRAYYKYVKNILNGYLDILKEVE